MLTPEQAREALAARRIHDGRNGARHLRLIPAIAELPVPLRRIAYGLIDRDALGHSLREGPGPAYTPFYYSRIRETLMAALSQLDALDSAERTRVFGIFFPRIAESVEQAWGHLLAAPYRHGGAGVMRAPGRPEVTREFRGSWLQNMINAVEPYDADLPWLAQHAGYMGYTAHTLAPLFAGVMDGGDALGDEVFAILTRTAHGEDEIGMMGNHIPLALLASMRPDGWEEVERLLLAAQREEGTRQMLLSAATSAHPLAFRRMAETILTYDLIRFTSVTGVVSGWLGVSWDVAQAQAAGRALARLTALLGDRAACVDALDGGAEDVALGLWALGGEDVVAALPLAVALLDDADATRRYAAARFLAETYLVEAREPLLRALDDPDPYVAGQACRGLTSGKAELSPEPEEFEHIEATLARMPAKATPEGQILWIESASPVSRESVARLLLAALGERGPKRLIPHLASMDSYTRAATAKLLAQEVDDPTCRAALLDLLGDRASWVRTEATRALAKATIAPEDAPTLEGLLARKTAALRQSLLELLLKQPDDAALASVDRLLATRNEQQRRAGLEALSLMAQAERAPEACAERATAYQRAHPAVSEVERALLAPSLEMRRETATLENALGLADPRDRAPIPDPVARDVRMETPPSVAALLALDALIEEHLTDSFLSEQGGASQSHLLGEMEGHLPWMGYQFTKVKDVEQAPLMDLWRGWAEARPAWQRDDDGLEFVRMLHLAAFYNLNQLHDGAERDAGTKLRHGRIAQTVCGWLIRLYPPPAVTADLLLDHLETTLATLPDAQVTAPQDERYPHLNRYQRLDHAVRMAQMYAEWFPDRWSDAHAARYWRLARWSQNLARPSLRIETSLALTLQARRAGAATEADVILQLIGPRAGASHAYYAAQFGEFAQLSARARNPLFDEYPFTEELYRRCVARVLEVELERGEMPTAATPIALSLRSLTGADWFIRLLRALGEDALTRGYDYEGKGRAYTLSHLLQVTFPALGDTLGAVSERLIAARISEKRLIAAALYAPQWARHIEATLGWEGLAQAVWWIYAHTRERNWRVDQTIRAEWAAQTSEWTPLSSDDLYDGAVDVAWFWRAYDLLGATRWDAVYVAAKYASSGNGHTRAQVFADAMLGRTEESALTERIRTKRRQDNVCALGLVPLPAEPKARDEALLRRYQVTQEFLRTSRKFGAQRRASEATVARIGLENLARTAGYQDAQRLQWAMEMEAVADLRAGPVRLTRDEVTLTLRIDALGQPHLDVARMGRTLKEIPARLKKDEAVAAMRERLKALGQQTARMRLSLEQMMCREEALVAEELRRLLGHPTLAPMLTQLVFVAGERLGYLADGGATLQAWDGARTPLAEDARLRIAHPYDLYRSGAWSEWQHECYQSERIQPFKQIFRELYLLTEAERQDGVVSRRYAGQQAQAKQAMALLGQRGWVSDIYEGDASRTFHERGLTATLGSLYGGMPEGDALTLDGVTFHRAGDPWGKPVPLAETPPLVFSEVMRDLDLVVSVAHRGGVDPESSASTVEMRAALIREVCGLLGLANVRLEANRAIIQGALSQYSVHLGGGTVHLLPGGSLCIVPVHEQHRGRIFLPFADDDPKTAEIISKILLLARDSEIKDPTILRQVYARG